jgi:hypothetical protein
MKQSLRLAEIIECAVCGCCTNPGSKKAREGTYLKNHEVFGGRIRWLCFFCYLDYRQREMRST